MKKISRLCLFLIAAWGLSSCELAKDPLENLSENKSSAKFPIVTPFADTTSNTSIQCNSVIWPLTAGQTIDAGTVTVSNDSQNLYITVYSNEGFQAVQENIKLWVGTDPDLTPAQGGLPVNGQGVPIPGQFPYKVTATGNQYTFVIPFSSIEGYNGVVNCSSKLYIYVHVDAIAGGGSETAWGGPTGVNVGTPGRWYFYGIYQAVCCDTPPPPSGGCVNTAFAKGGWVFTKNLMANPERLPSLNLTRNRWGWAINLTAPGIYYYDIWAGAGLNNTSKGKLVGKLTVNWSGSLATVTYTMNSGYGMKELHLYIDDNKPTTVAPGQYGNTAGFSSTAVTYTNTYNVSDSNGDGIWIIAHAGVFY